MSTLPKFLLKKRTYFIIAFIAFWIFAYNFLQVRKSDEHFVANLSDNMFGYIPKVVHYDTLGRHMRYIEIGDDDKPLLVLLHGAPSSSSFWEGYLMDSILLSNFKIIAPDRPGYGYSDYGIPETSIQKQAAITSAILKHKNAIHNKIIIHGSSYGGTLAVRLAMDYPHLVNGMILQSASTLSGAEKIYDLTYPTSKKPLSYLIPSSIQMANQEKLSHKKELKKMDKWKNITAYTIILHGDEDNLIYPTNADFAYTNIKNSPHKEIWWANKAGHTLAFTNKSMLIKAMLTMKKWVTDPDAL